MIFCKLCNKKFNSFKELTKHLVEEHNYSLSQIYEYFDYSFETGAAVCPVCGEEFRMTKRQMSGFQKNPNKSIGCCASCSKSLIIISHGSPFKREEVREKIRETMKSLYNAEHPMHSEIIKQKQKETNLEKYGVENVFQAEEIREKSKKTNLEKYGTEYAIGSEIVRNKAKDTLMNNFGVENAFQSEEIKKKIKKKNLEQLGVEHPMQSKKTQDKMKKTNLEKYKVEFPLQSKEIQEQVKKTNLERLGVEFTWQSKEIQKKKTETMLKRYGFEYPMQVPEIKEKMKKNNLEKYGTEYVLQADEVREKMSKTNFEKYKVKYFCQHENCYKNNYLRISKVNKKFQDTLAKKGIESELEFIVEDSGYDLKVRDTLVEINPWFTHNTTVGPFIGGKMREPKPVSYHLDKTVSAERNGYTCIHIFDWDDWNKVVMILESRQKIAARKCFVKELSVKEANKFIDAYHLQGSTRQVLYAYGLYYNDTLVQVMTFGKPRYNKNYEYELLRLCALPGISIIGGAGKLFKYFAEHVKPGSVISYCDLSKFNGDVYSKIGFKKANQTPPAKHWYNPKTKVHITDNLLRQRGFDQLHNTNYGKGTSNEQLMLEHGYVEIYDCGQLVFTKFFDD